MPAETDRKLPLLLLNRLRHWTSEDGNSLIELAVTLPVFLLFVFGFINFALVLFGSGNITYAARSAARYGCIHSSTSMVPAVATDFPTIVNPYIPAYPSNTHTATVTYLNSGLNTVGSSLEVVVSVTYKIVLPGYTYNALPVSAKSDCLIVQ